MILRKLQISPAKKIPVAMALVTTGLLMIVAGVVWPAPSVPATHLGTNWYDFWRGVVFGIAIVMEISGLVIAMTGVKGGKKL